MTSVLSRTDSLYPPLLLQIPDPPECLWVEGDLALLSEISLAVVGARRCTPYGEKVAGDLSRQLAEAGVTVVSGMAFGVDAAAHRGALSGGGRTIAVLGTGIDITYPKEHEGLRKEIAAHGAVVSELPPGTQAAPWTFPARNRIISGLSRGVVVVEAREKSGALITSRHALDQGREVFAVPGDIRSPLSGGCHRLIQSGAKLVTGIRDILEEVGASVPGGVSVCSAPTEEGTILNLLTDGPRHIDEIVRTSGFSVEKVSPLLVGMEIDGKVRSLPGSYFVRS